MNNGDLITVSAVIPASTSTLLGTSAIPGVPANMSAVIHSVTYSVDPSSAAGTVIARLQSQVGTVVQTLDTAVLAGNSLTVEHKTEPARVSAGGNILASSSGTVHIEVRFKYEYGRL